jgi:hypothetical protein
MFLTSGQPRVKLSQLRSSQLFETDHSKALYVHICMYGSFYCHLPSLVNTTLIFTGYIVRQTKKIPWKTLRLSWDSRANWAIVSSQHPLPANLYVQCMGLHHGLINSIDTEAKCRQLKKWPVKGLCGRCLSEFIDWWYSQSLVFSTLLSG